MLNLQSTKLLSNYVIDMFNYDECKNNVKKLLAKYEMLEYKFINLDKPKITSNYEFKYESYVPKKVDSVGRYVETKLDTEAEVQAFYSHLIDVALTFTKDERVYFINSLLKGISEEVICHQLSISKTTLTTIKKSCIIKIALAFNKEIEL